MKTIQVDTFTVDFFETIALIDGLLDIARRVKADRSACVFHIDEIYWKSYAPAVIVRHFDGDGVANLNGVSADFKELVAQDFSVAIARRVKTGVGPDAVAANVAEGRIGHRELLGSFFE